MNLHIHATPEAASRDLARKISDLIRGAENSSRPPVLGLATGRSPIPLYKELIRLHREEGLSFADVITFNLDEYLGLGPDHPQSYHRFMWENLFGHLDVRPENVHIPDGQVGESEWSAAAAEYDALIQSSGGIDLQILGIGRTGHIGFNEPGAGMDSPTRIVELDEMTRADAAADFGNVNAVPTRAFTMGCRPILAARSIALLAWGPRKADIVARALLGEISEDVPASFLRRHPSVEVYLDESAAASLRPASVGKTPCFE